MGERAPRLRELASVDFRQALNTEALPHRVDPVAREHTTEGDTFEHRARIRDVAGLAVPPAGCDHREEGNTSLAKDADRLAADVGAVPGTVLVGRYRVERVLGRGGMGIVVEARHITLEERVAVKLLLAEHAATDEAHARFVREAKAAARIKSEHVVRVSDVGTLDTGVAYMVMEYLEGDDLARLLSKGGPLSIRDAIDFIVQGCEAIAEAHGHGIVHRDIKPSNLFLTTRNDGSPQIKLLDFGISQLADDASTKLTRTETAMGSALYMSPEQMRDTKSVDLRTDIYALGITLHELLAGRPPFFAETIIELCTKLATEDPEPLRTRRPDADEGLAYVIARAHERDVSLRYRSIPELVAALAPWAPPRSQGTLDRVMRMARLPPVIAGTAYAAHVHPRASAPALAAPALPSTALLPAMAIPLASATPFGAPPSAPAASSQVWRSELHPSGAGNSTWGSQQHPTRAPEPAPGSAAETASGPVARVLATAARGAAFEEPAVNAATFKPIDVHSRRAERSPRALGAIGGLVLAVGAVGVWMLIGRDAPTSIQAVASSAPPKAPIEPPSPISSTSSSPPNTADVAVTPGATGSAGTSPSAPVVRTVLVTVVPAAASVQIDGTPATPTNGVVAITGPIGSSHQVRVSFGGRDVASEVFVGETGAVPARIELGAAPRAVKPGSPPTGGPTPAAAPPAGPKAPPPAAATAKPSSTFDRVFTP